ncbi:unnamed protein product [Closterium sp. NIES-53]
MIALCQEHIQEHRTKHIALRYFLSRELQQRGQLRLAYVATRANTADVFTKALPPVDHQRFVTVLGLRPRHLPRGPRAALPGPDPPPSGLVAHPFGIAPPYGPTAALTCGPATLTCGPRRPYLRTPPLLPAAPSPSPAAPPPLPAAPSPVPAALPPLPAAPPPLPAAQPPSPAASPHLPAVPAALNCGLAAPYLRPRRPYLRPRCLLETKDGVYED